MRPANEALANILRGVKQAVHDGEYQVASRYTEDFITLAYHLQLKKDLFLGEVLGSVYAQIDSEIETHAVSDEDKSALNKLMVHNLDDLMKAYVAEGDVYDALINMRYNATAFQSATITKYDYKPLSLPPERS